MQDEGVGKPAAPGAPIDEETRRFVSEATAQLVNAAITRRALSAARREALRFAQEERVWHAVLGVAALCVALLGLFALTNLMHE